MRKSLPFLGGFLQNLTKGKENFFTSLWNKPVTDDDRVKDYIPEVVEESILEEKAVRLENNSRDIIVELGNKIITEMEKRSPTSRIAPYLNQIVSEYGVKELILQRPLSFLIYPNSNVLPSSNADTPHDLILSFNDNFKALIEEIERSGCSAKQKNAIVATATAILNDKDVAPTNDSASSPNDSPVASGQDDGVVSDVEAAHRADCEEPLDITLFVKVTAGMALANVNCGDLQSAVRCVDAGLLHAKDPQRIGGLYGMKAGILIREKKYIEAVEAAKKAIDVSQNLQGYIHGSYALHQLDRIQEEVDLLESGREVFPMEQLLVHRLSEAKKAIPVVSESLQLE